MPAPISLQETALDHLRIIRTLMERAHIYRAVSAPAALSGGLLSLGVAAYGFWQNDFFVNHSEAVRARFGAHEFLFAWLGVLVITSIINFLLLMREAGNKGQPFLSDGLRMALRAIIPPMLTGGVLGICLIIDQQFELAALVWILCYGLALQATVSFAPRSIIRLARAFLIAGQALTLFYFANGSLGMFQRHEAPASIFLGVTFGLFHIVYGIAISCTKGKKPASRSDGVVG